MAVAALALAVSAPASAAGPICAAGTSAQFKTALADAGCTTINLAAGAYTDTTSFIASHTVTVNGALKKLTSNTDYSYNGARYSPETTRSASSSSSRMRRQAWM